MMNIRDYFLINKTKKVNKINIDERYVKKQLDNVYKDTDISKFIL